MKIKLNGSTLNCHRCGSLDLEIININDENNYIIWCNECEEETHEDLIKVDKIKFLDIWN